MPNATKCSSQICLRAAARRVTSTIGGQAVARDLCDPCTDKMVEICRVLGADVAVGPLEQAQEVHADLYDPDRMPRRLARLSVDAEILRNALHLPASVFIADVAWEGRAHLNWPGVVVLTLEGDAFPHVVPDAEPPRLNVVLHRDKEGRVTLERMEVVP